MMLLGFDFSSTVLQCSKNKKVIKFSLGFVMKGTFFIAKAFFTIIGKNKWKATCTFGKLSEVSEASHGQSYKENYLDSTGRFPINHNAILQRIKNMMKKKLCRAYSLFTNNCEHLVTYVRYGKKISEQVCSRIEQNRINTFRGQLIIKQVSESVLSPNVSLIFVTNGQRSKLT